jgi:hypothetical protein
MSFSASSPLLSKFLSRSARKVLPLTAKRAKKGYVKGVTGMTKQGYATSKGGFVLDRARMLEIVAPPLDPAGDFHLRPYVAAHVPKQTPRALYEEPE